MGVGRWALELNPTPYTLNPTPCTKCRIGENGNEVIRVTMAVRVGELAQELKMTNTEMMAALTDLGVAVPGPAAMIDADTAQAVREVYSKSNGALIRRSQLSIELRNPSRPRIRSQA